MDDRIETAEIGGLTTWASLCERYDGFIFDQFGVMHNGAEAIPGAPELIRRLKEMGKRLVILSNSSKRSEWTLHELRKFHIPADAFVGAVTSGEEAWQALRERWSGRKCVWIAKADGSGVTDYLQGTGVELSTVEEADMILCTGTSTIRSGGKASDIIQVGTETTGALEPYEELFTRGIARGLLLLCANPDFVSPAKPGCLETFQPGHLARRYEELGGRVIYYGKPHPEHFEACVRLLSLERERVAHVGDSMHHDIRGALSADLPVVFVAGGIESASLGLATAPGRQPEESGLPKTAFKEALSALFVRYEVVPTHTVLLARW